MASAAPPSLPGLPLIGNLLDYRRDHVDVFWRGYARFGKLFSFRLGPRRAVVMLGPEHHRFFFSETDGILSVPEVYRFVVPMFGPVLNASEDAQVRAEQLALLQTAFQGRKMDGYVTAMRQEVLAWMDALGDEGQFPLWASFEALGARIATRALMGAELRQRIDEFMPLFRDLCNGMEFVLPPNLPLARFRRRDRARAQLVEMIRPVLAQRQADPDPPDDFLQALIGATRQRGGPLTDEALVGLALLTVFTGYIATAAQSCWGLIQLLQDPRYLASVVEEQRSVWGDDPEALDADALGRLERLAWGLKETIRLRPVMSHYARYNARDYELDGYQIPRGWLTIVCPAVSHRLPEVFSNPHAYDPERFGPQRAEDRRHPYSLIGFGGGFYRCPGSQFGMNEMKTALTLLLSRYTLELAGPDPQPDYEIGIVRPNPSFAIRYRRRAARPYPVTVGASERLGRCPVHAAERVAGTPAAN
jgi:sterol 14-demethylase